MRQVISIVLLFTFSVYGQKATIGIADKDSIIETLSKRYYFDSLFFAPLKNCAANYLQLKDDRIRANYDQMEKACYMTIERRNRDYDSLYKMIECYENLNQEFDSILHEANTKLLETTFDFLLSKNNQFCQPNKLIGLVFYTDRFSGILDSNVNTRFVTKLFSSQINNSWILEIEQYIFELRKQYIELITSTYAKYYSIN